MRDLVGPLSREALNSTDETFEPFVVIQLDAILDARILNRLVGGEAFGGLGMTLRDNLTEIVEASLKER